jgi:hypothetical protein
VRRRAGATLDAIQTEFAIKIMGPMVERTVTRALRRRGKLKSARASDLLSNAILDLGRIFGDLIGFIFLGLVGQRGIRVGFGEDHRCRGNRMPVALRPKRRQQNASLRRRLRRAV